MYLQCCRLFLFTSICLSTTTCSIWTQQQRTNTLTNTLFTSVYNNKGHNSAVALSKDSALIRWHLQNNPSWSILPLKSPHPHPVYLIATKHPHTAKDALNKKIHLYIKHVLFVVLLKFKYLHVKMYDLMTISNRHRITISTIWYNFCKFSVIKITFKLKS